ncbi:MAG TPA: ATP-binding protein [Rhizomicrobium sp.]|nr:ATP-binding protein [Rhizomicrobium sp.]
MRFWPRKLASQLIVVTAAAVLISNLAVAAWFELGRERMSETAFTERLLDRAVSAATLLSTVPARQREKAARSMNSAVWRFKLLHGKAVTVPMTASELALAERARALLPPQRTRQPVIVKVVSNEDREKGKIRNRRPVITITVPVVRGTQLVTTFYRPPSPPWPIETFIAAVVAIVVTSIAAALVARRVARPLSKLSAAATIAAQGGMAPHVPEEGPEDVRRAASAFNTMTDQVSRTLESQRQLLSAVGHDLRTPITAMRINIEFVNDPELRERLERNLGELQELTEAVLSAARGTGGEPKRNVDLAALTESLCADFDDMGKPVTWHPHVPAPILCRPNEIRRAIRNLIENAIAYGKEANVRIDGRAMGYEIVVEDKGPGIPEVDLQRVFEPFVRLETSRNVETGGTGLGLTLVRTIAAGHDGKVTLENRAEGGLRARLYLPIPIPAS